MPHRDTSGFIWRGNPGAFDRPYDIVLKAACPNLSAGSPTKDPFPERIPSMDIQLAHRLGNAFPHFNPDLNDRPAAEPRRFQGAADEADIEAEAPRGAPAAEQASEQPAAHLEREGMIILNRLDLEREGTNTLHRLGRTFRGRGTVRSGCIFASLGALSLALSLLVLKGKITLPRNTPQRPLAHGLIIGGVIYLVFGQGLLLANFFARRAESNARMPFRAMPPAQPRVERTPDINPTPTFVVVEAPDLTLSLAAVPPAALHVTQPAQP